VVEYRKIEGMLGEGAAEEFSTFIKLLHEEPDTAKRWNHKEVKKSFSRARGLGSSSTTVELSSTDRSPPSSSSSERFELAGTEYEAAELTPDILNALKKEEHVGILTGVRSPRPAARSTHASDYYVCSSVGKVKVRWETGVHYYHLLLFEQLLVLTKVRGRTMRIVRIVRLQQMCIGEYRDSSGFKHVEKPDQAFLATWLGFEMDEEQLLHRVILSFPNRDSRVHWYSLLARHIQRAQEKMGLTRGVIRVYFKQSDSRVTVAGDSSWQGMACQELQVELATTVEEVIEEAVKVCQMVDHAYTLSFLVLQKKAIVSAEELVWMERPLALRHGYAKSCTGSGGPAGRGDRSLEYIFVLQESAERSSPTSLPPSGRLNTVFNFTLKGSTRSASRPRLYSSLLPTPATSANTVFGVPLSTLMPEETVPGCILELMLYIYTSCHNCEGIFRVPGSLVVQKTYEKRLEAGETIDWLGEEAQDRFFVPNVASSLLKYFYRSLPGGLVPKHLFPVLELWRAERETEGTPAAGVARMKELLERVPRPNLALLRYTLHLLRRIDAYSSVNLMDCKTLATCIGPSLVSWPEDAAALSILADKERRQTPCVVVEFLLTHVGELVGREPRVFARSGGEGAEEVVSRRSKLVCSEDEEEEAEEEEDEEMWRLMRSSIHEMNGEEGEPRC